MEQTGSLKSLAERMREKAEQERIETEKVFIEQLQTLKDSLQESSQNVLHTMSDAMGQEITGVTERLSEQYRVLSMAFGRKWIALAALGAGLCLGMVAAGWVTMEIWVWQLADYRSELAQLKQNTQAQRQALANLKSETWNLELLEDKDGRFIILPPGVKPNPRFWNIGTRKAIKLER